MMAEGDADSIQVASKPVCDQGQRKHVRERSAQVEHEMELGAADPGEERASGSAILLLNRFLQTADGNTVQ